MTELISTVEELERRLGSTVSPDYMMSVNATTLRALLLAVHAAKAYRDAHEQPSIVHDEDWANSWRERLTASRDDLDAILGSLFVLQPAGTEAAS